MKDYLTEESLGIFLNEYLREGEWIHDKSFLCKMRPDYRNDSTKTIVEFDGYLHYTSAKRIISDKIKDELYINNGYHVIRIPYFVQLSEQVIYNLFEIDIDYKQNYPHGFIDKTCILPADFCSLGIEKFKNDLKRFHFISDEITKSLLNKIETYGDRRYVLPLGFEFE